LRHSTLVWIVLLATVALNVWLYVIVPKGFFRSRTRPPDRLHPRGPGHVVPGDAHQARQLYPDRPDRPGRGQRGGLHGGSQRNTGQMFVTLKPLSERKESADAIIARLRGKLAKEPGASLFLQSVQDIRVGGRQSSSQYQFTLQSDDLDVLRDWEPRFAPRSRTSRASRTSTPIPMTRACRRR
jgi:multidrug efflux pump